MNVNIKFDNASVDEYVKEIQKSFPDIKINVLNVNDYATSLQQTKNCAICKSFEDCKNPNKGFCYKADKNGNFNLVECSFSSIKRINDDQSRFIKTLYMPKTISEATFANYDMSCESRQRAYKRTLEFIDSFKRNEEVKGLYLTGTFGIGKTYTLACIANELAKNSISSLLIYFPDLVIDLKDSIGTSRFQDIMNMLKSIDVLMLDDLGSENMTPWLRDEILGPVLNYRILEGKPVFISTNLSYNDLKAHLAIDKNPANAIKAERLLSRLQGLIRNIDMNDSKNYRK